MVSLAWRRQKNRRNMFRVQHVKRRLDRSARPDLTFLPQITIDTGNCRLLLQFVAGERHLQQSKRCRRQLTSICTPGIIGPIICRTSVQPAVTNIAVSLYLGCLEVGDRFDPKQARDAHPTCAVEAKERKGLPMYNQLVSSRSVILHWRLSFNPIAPGSCARRLAESSERDQHRF